MDISFKEALTLHGLNSESNAILEEEGIISMKIAKTLEKEHLTQLLQVLKIAGATCSVVRFFGNSST